MFPTPEQELESKIREECFQERIRVIKEISNEVGNTLSYLFCILLENKVSNELLKIAVDSVNNIMKNDSGKNNSSKNFDEAKQLVEKLFS